MISCVSLVKTDIKIKTNSQKEEPTCWQNGTKLKNKHFALVFACLKD